MARKRIRKVVGSPRVKGEVGHCWHETYVECSRELEVGRGLDGCNCGDDASGLLSPLFYERSAQLCFRADPGGGRVQVSHAHHAPASFASAPNTRETGALTVTSCAMSTANGKAAGSCSPLVIVPSATPLIADKDAAQRPA